MPRTHHRESHYTERIGWLRAAVLGANDDIVSTASLMIGVAAGHGDRSALLVAQVARQLMDLDALGAHARDELGILGRSGHGHHRRCWGAIWYHRLTP